MTTTEETLFSNKEEKETKVEDQSTTPKDDQPSGEKESQTVDINSLFADQLKRITDDNGEQKYKDLPTALEALYHSQKHIKTLEQENLEKEKAITQMETLQQAQQNLSSLNTEQATQEPTSSQGKGVSQEEIENIALSAFEKRKALETQEANKAKVEKEILAKTAGDVEKAAKIFSSKAEELGLSVQDLTDLSKKSPNAVLAYFKGDSNDTLKATKSSVNSEALKTVGLKSQDTNDIPKFLSNSSSPESSAWKAAGEKVLNRLNTNDYN